MGIFGGTFDRFTYAHLRTAFELQGLAQGNRFFRGQSTAHETSPIADAKLAWRGGRGRPPASRGWGRRSRSAHKGGGGRVARAIGGNPGRTRHEYPDRSLCLSSHGLHYEPAKVASMAGSAATGANLGRWHTAQAGVHRDGAARGTGGGSGHGRSMICHETRFRCIFIIP